MSSIPAPPLKLRANNPASYSGYGRLWRPPNTTAPMFRHLLPKIPEEVPIISEDYQMSQYEARNRAWSCKLLIEDTHATLSTVHSWTILFGKWTPFFTQLWVRSEKLLRMWSFVRGQWTCHVVAFVDITLGYRITLTKRNTDTAFLCMVLVSLPWDRVSDFREVCPIKTGSESASNRVLNKGFSLHQAHKQLFWGMCPLAVSQHVFFLGSQQMSSCSLCFAC